MIKNIEKNEKTKWIFTYLRADWEYIDIGPYNSREEAQKAVDTMVNLGAYYCTGSMEVSNDYELYKG